MACAAVMLNAGIAQAQESAVAAVADDGGGGRPRWEIGAAALGGRVADYPGSDQSHVRGLVAPVVLYRGPVFRVDQGGVRGRVVNTPDWEFDLSATGAFNARNNDARAGMPDLDYLFGVGPQLVYKGWRKGGMGLSLHLKLRAMLSTDFHRLNGRGFTFDPELRWRARPFAGSPTTLTLSLQPTWATQALHRYFYQVDASQATATRPAYTARAGYLGTEAGLNLSHPQGKTLTWFFNVNGMSLHGSANAGSPLLKTGTNVGVLAGVVWTPWQSAERASD